jgi:hypothetical protein
MAKKRTLLQQPTNPTTVPHNTNDVIVNKYANKPITIGSSGSSFIVLELLATEQHQLVLFVVLVVIVVSPINSAWLIVIELIISGGSSCSSSSRRRSRSSLQPALDGLIRPLSASSSSSPSFSRCGRLPSS